MRHLLWISRSNHDSAEWLITAHCLIFSAALGYSTVLSYLYTQGMASGPSPWYSQVLLSPVFVLALLGCSRAGVAGRALASGLVLSAYILVISYFGKLMPLYAGFPGRASLGASVARYTTNFEQLLGNLDTVSLASAGVIVGLAAAVSGLAFLQAAVTVRSLLVAADAVSHHSK